MRSRAREKIGPHREDCYKIKSINGKLKLKRLKIEELMMFEKLKKSVMH
jgi:hypothetical protein